MVHWINIHVTERVEVLPQLVSITSILYAYRRLGFRGIGSHSGCRIHRTRMLFPDPQYTKLQDSVEHLRIQRLECKLHWAIPDLVPVQHGVGQLAYSHSRDSGTKGGFTTSTWMYYSHFHIPTFKQYQQLARQWCDAACSILTRPLLSLRFWNDCRPIVLLHAVLVPSQE